MVNRKRDKDYIRKVIRVNQNYIVLCDFLDFYAGYKGKNKFEFYNNLFNYSLKKIDGDVGYRFKKYPDLGYGVTRSFFFNKKTLIQLTKKHYSKNIEKKILDVFDFDFGIKK